MHFVMRQIYGVLMLFSFFEAFYIATFHDDWCVDRRFRLGGIRCSGCKYSVVFAPIAAVARKTFFTRNDG